MSKILVVDDEQAIAILIKNILVKQGYEVVYKTSALDVELNKINQYELIILDVMMPEMDGFTFCQKVREITHVPILFLTAKTAEVDMLQGLAVGGDDYIKKPFSNAELVARVVAHLRRETREQKQLFFDQDISFNLSEKKCLIKEESLDLTKGEYDICIELALHKGQVFSKDQLYEQVAGFNGESDSSSIVEHIKNIRAKFKAKGYSVIETIWGVGYKWEIKQSESR